MLLAYKKSKNMATVLAQSSSKMYLNIKKTQMLIRQVAGYPKVTYLPLVLFACGTYGYKSVKQTSI